MTKIEKATQHLMTVEMYSAKLFAAGKPISIRTIRNRIDQILANTITPEEAGFTVHTICGKYFIEDLSVAPAGKLVTFGG